MNNISVSVLVPICNVERYLRDCLDSLLAQNLPSMEFICLNDGSTDSSLDILREYEKRDKRIIVVDKPNSGYGDSMNVGLRLSRGEYIGIVESDDFASPDMFEKLYGLAKRHDADVVKSNFFSHITGDMPEDDQFTENLFGCKYGSLFNPKKDQNVFLGRPAIWSGLYKRDFLISNNIEFLPTPGASFQDTAFNFKVFAAAERAFLTKEAFLHYRIDNANSSVKSQKKVFCICDEYQEIWNFAKKDNQRYESLKKRIPQLQFGGYLWNLDRLTPGLQFNFYSQFVEEFQQIEKANLLDEGFFDQVAWNKLSSMLSDPSSYYFENYGPNRIDLSCILGFTADFPVDRIVEASKKLSSKLPVFSEIFVFSPSISSGFEELHNWDKRFTDIDEILDSWISETIHPAALRGDKLLALTISDLSQIEALLSYLDVQDFSSGVNRLNNNNCSIFDITDLSDTYDVVFIPLLQLMDAKKNIASCQMDTLGSALSQSSLSYQVDGKEYDKAWASMLGLIDQFNREIDASDYLLRRSVYRHLLPLWKRIRQAYNALSFSERIERLEPSADNLITIEYPHKDVSSPKVSVVVPVYNMQKYLEEALDSICQQDFDSFEIICVNDGSTDGSLNILESFADKYSNIRVVSQLNGGAGSARNCGINFARGSYVLFIDPDDSYPTNNVISTLYDAAINNAAKIVGGSFGLIEADGTMVDSFNGDNDFYTFAEEGFSSFRDLTSDYGWIRFMFSRDLFNHEDLRFPNYSWYEDPVFLMRVALRQDEFYKVPNLTYRYRADYKKIEWDVMKARSIVRGIQENLTAAQTLNNPALYTTLIRRIECDYYDAIMSNIQDEEVFTRLAEIQSSLNCSMINFVRESRDQTHLLRPLAFCALKASGASCLRDNAIVRLAKKLGNSFLYKRIQSFIERLRGIS